MVSHQILTDAQREKILKLPAKMSRAELRQYYTFSEDELVLIGERRENRNRLGMAIQLAFLRFPGRALTLHEKVPKYLLDFLCLHLELENDSFYERDETRKEHFSLIKRRLKYRRFRDSLSDLVAKPLFELALKVDDGQVLIQEALNEFRRQKLIIPGITRLEELVWNVREEARQAIQDLMVKDLSIDQKLRLDQLLELKTPSQTYLSWLRKPNGNPSPNNVLKVIEKLKYIRSIGFNLELQQYVHQSRFLKLARQGSIYPVQDLSKFASEKRYSLLVAYLLTLIEELTDQVFDMHDRQMGGMINRCKKQAEHEFYSKRRAIKEKLKHFIQIGDALIEAKANQQDAFERLASLIAWDDFIESVEEARLLTESKKLDALALTKSKYQRMRPYIKEMLNEFEYQFSPPCRDLQGAVQVLRELNEENKRNLPPDMPDSFVKDRWHSLIFDTEDQSDRRYYEVCCMLELKDRLRAGDVSVTGSRKYKDFYAYWLADAPWQRMWEAHDLPLQIPQDFKAYIQPRIALLKEEFERVSGMLERDEIPEVKLKDGELNISRLDKDVPDSIESQTQRIYNLVPRVKITELLLEVDEMTGFTQCFRNQMTGNTHKNTEALLSVLLAQATNMGYANMADALPDLTARQLQNTEEKYITEDNLKQAQAILVDFQSQLPFTQYFGSGTTSSSDGQSFKLAKHDASWLNLNAKYGQDPVMTIYTHISDQYMPFYTQVIHNVRDATHVLDGLLYHDTNLEIEEHYTDTAGFTDHVFALCHLLGFRFAPRIRDLKEKNLFYVDKSIQKTNLKPLLGERLKLEKIQDNWEHILRLASSVKMGTVQASLMLKKLAAYPRQNSFALALRELGRLERTLFILKWLQEPQLRRKVLIGLNKGELKHALADAICFYRQGIIRDRDYTDQLHRASSLNLVIAAIVLWNTVYLEMAIQDMQRMEPVPDEVLNHLSPMRWQHIRLSGDYVWKKRKHGLSI